LNKTETLIEHISALEIYFAFTHRAQARHLRNPSQCLLRRGSWWASAVQGSTSVDDVTGRDACHRPRANALRGLT